MTHNDALAAFLGPELFARLDWSLLSEAQRAAILSVFRVGICAGAASGTVAVIDEVLADGRKMLDAYMCVGLYAAPKLANRAQNAMRNIFYSRGKSYPRDAGEPKNDFQNDLTGGYLGGGFVKSLFLATDRLEWFLAPAAPKIQWGRVESVRAGMSSAAAPWSSTVRKRCSGAGR